jgi:hypothetical protein
MDKVDDWQSLVNKPAISNDKKEIGVVSSVQPLHIPNKYNIPKELVTKLENGIVYLNSSQKDIEDKYEFE